MIACFDCGKECKSPAGLASHRRARHADDADAPASSRNVAAARRTIDELKRMGRIETVDDAQVQAVLSVAAALDANPFNSQMWREYREALKELRADDDDDGDIEALLRELSDPEVRDPTSP